MSRLRLRSEIISGGQLGFPGGPYVIPNNGQDQPYLALNLTGEMFLFKTINTVLVVM